MISKDFYGRKYIWWTGKVVSRQDKLGLGRVQIRIFGIHGDDIADDKLPWAQILYAANNSKSFGSITEGDWVHGFFQDGENAQIPIVESVYHIIKPQGSSNQKSASTSAASSSSTKSATGTPTVPIMPTFGNWTQSYRVLDRPTIPLLSQQLQNATQLIDGVPKSLIENTPLGWTNTQLKAACNISSVVDMTIVGEKLPFSEAIQALRAGINALLASLNTDPTGLMALATSMAKDILKYVRYIQSMIAEVQEIVGRVMSAISAIKRLIQFITNLPDRLMGFVLHCFSSFIESIQGVFGSMMNMSQFGNINELVLTLIELKAVSQQTISQARNTLTSVQDVGNYASTISTDFANLNQTYSNLSLKNINVKDTFINNNPSLSQITKDVINGNVTSDTMQSVATQITRNIVASNPSRDANKQQNIYSIPSNSKP